MASSSHGAATTMPEGLTHAKLGMWLFLASEVMLFATLFTSYVIFRTTAPVWPHGWTDQNKAEYARIMQFALDAYDERQRLFNEPANDANFKRMGRELAMAPGSPYNWLAHLAIPNFQKAASKTMENQTLLNEVFVACVLERYRAAKGSYPERLDALVPEFASQLPHDLFDGQPLRYHRGGDGKYVLYSIGWNSKDDGGVSARDKQGAPVWSFATGDWVLPVAPN